MDRTTADSLPRLTDLTAALGTLTLLPFDAPAPQSPSLGRASIFFPLCGVLMGVLLVTIAHLLQTRLSAAQSAAVLVIIWEALGGFRAVTAVAASLGGDTRPVRWAGVAAVLALIFVKAMGLSATAAVPVAVLFAPTLGRWAIVVLATGARDAAQPNRKFNSAINFQQFALASVFTFGALFTLAGATGILLVVCAAALTLVLRLLLHRWPGGVSWGWLLGCCEGVETAVVIVCALLAR